VISVGGVVPEVNTAKARSFEGGGWAADGRDKFLDKKNRLNEKTD